MATNDFQEWLIAQGFSRNSNGGEWIKDSVVVSGSELYKKLEEFKNTPKQ